MNWCPGLPKGRNMKFRLSLVIAFCFVTISAMSQILTTRVIEDFDGPGIQEWLVTGSVFKYPGYPRSRLINTWPTSLFGKNPADGAELNSLGIHGRFYRKAHNHIDIIPVSTNSAGKVEPTPIELPGQVRYIDLWVWCSKYDFNIEVHVQDYQEIDYVLQLGSLRHEGWRKLSAWIPSTIPQMEIHLPKYKTLKLTKFRIWTSPKERVSDFYVYMDHVTVITDVYQERFDGDELADPQWTEEVWSD